MHINSTFLDEIFHCVTEQITFNHCVLPGGKFVLRSMMRGRVIRGRLGVIRSRGGVIRGGVIGGGGIGAISHSHGQHRGQH